MLFGSTAWAGKEPLLGQILPGILMRAGGDGDSDGDRRGTLPGPGCLGDSHHQEFRHGTWQHFRTGVSSKGKVAELSQLRQPQPS